MWPVASLLYKISDVEDSHISYFRKPNIYDPDLHNLMKNRNGTLITSNTLDKKPNMEGISNSRGAHMSRLRNDFKNKHGLLNSDYSILLDADVIFNENTLYKMFTSDIGIRVRKKLSYHQK